MNEQKPNDVNRLLPEADVAPGEAQPPQKAEARSIVQKLDVLLLNAAGRICPESRIEISCTDRGTTYAIYAADGELEDSGSDWTPLVKRFETEFMGTSEPLSIIWP